MATGRVNVGGYPDLNESIDARGIACDFSRNNSRLSRLTQPRTVGGRFVKNVFFDSNKVDIYIVAESDVTKINEELNKVYSKTFSHIQTSCIDENNNIYLFSISYNDRVRKLIKINRNGTTVFEKDYSIINYNSVFLTYYNNKIYLAEDNILYVLNKDSGEIENQLDLKTKILDYIKCEDNSIYVPIQNKVLKLSLDLKNISEYNFQSANPLNIYIDIYNKNTIFVLTTDVKIYQFDFDLNLVSQNTIPISVKKIYLRDVFGNFFMDYQDGNQVGICKIGSNIFTDSSVIIKESANVSFLISQIRNKFLSYDQYGNIEVYEQQGELTKIAITQE